MRPIEVSVLIPASPFEVWAEVERIEDHPTWMADAVGVEFESATRRGKGTRISVLTRIGPFRTTDEMEFTDWDPPRTMGVAHRGLFTGTGRFTLETEGDGTRFTWTEEIRFPWYLGGPVGGLVARPILARVWKGNLRRLRDRVSGP
ncbi:MAG TPA: SRPBCC family protein [Acidimicrobiia bacterium]|nr:SRPBCC family protein [Acidimicrobiia bacterium]